MKKKNKLILIQTLIAIVILITTTVYAAISVKLELSVSNSKLAPGDEVTVKLSIKDIQVSDEGITNIDGYINYDKNIIEPLTVNSIVRDSDGRVTIGNNKLSVEDLTGATSVNTGDNTTGIVFNGKPASNNDCRLLIGLATPIKEDTDLITIKFKIKQNATLGEFENAIKYDMFVITAGEEKTPAISEAVTLTVDKVTNPKPENNVENETKNEVENEIKNEVKNEIKNETKNEVKNEVKNETKNNVSNKPNSNTSVNNTSKNTSNNTSNTNKNNVVNNTNKVDNSALVGKLPKAGSRIMILPIVAVIILAYISYNRYMNPLSQR